MGNDNEVRDGGKPQSAIRNPQSGSAAAHDLHDVQDLQRRVLREVQRSRPLAEMILAIHMSQGHIDAATAWRFLATGRSADAGRVECMALCRKAQRMLGEPPTQPAGPGLSTMAVLAGFVGIRTSAWRNWQARRESYERAMSDYCRRLMCCTPPQGMVRASEIDQAANAREGIHDQPPLVRLGPGGDYTTDIDLVAGDEIIVEEPARLPTAPRAEL